jgi:NADH-quinone oxidoreductase subunit G
MLDSFLQGKKMPKLKVNGLEVEFEQGMTVLQACEVAGAEVPRFCYHERLKIAGNCRMCLVQVEGGPPKPAASCAMPAADGMVVHTDTPMVKKAREGVMEFLLMNHPLDCPICDQAGECDLQDETMAYARGNSRFAEHKRAVKDKYMGPLVKTQMTRCIHCTRCVRFLDEVAGVHELGAIGRGEHMEISTYVEKSLSSEMSANIIDLCPVGALTSKPYAFKARPWELTKTETIDVMDAVGSNIRVDSRGLEVMRILPRLNEEVNEEWISDKTRFACDGLKTQRLDRPYVRKNGKLVAVSWNEALQLVGEKLKGAGAKSAAIMGDLADCESMLALKELMLLLGSHNFDCRQDGVKVGKGERGSYLFNTGICGIKDADAILIIGSNPRWEAPIVNTGIRKAWMGGAKIAYLGQELSLNYQVNHLGDNALILEDILAGENAFSKVLSDAKNPAIIVGYDALTRKDGEAILCEAQNIAEKYNMLRDGWNGFNVLHRAASRVGGLDLNIMPSRDGKDTHGIISACAKGEIEVLYLLGADEIDCDALGNAFVIYQGHHGDKGAHRADAILPGAAYTEKNATYVNLEGRVQRAYKAVSPVGEAQEDWQIVKMAANAAGLEFVYNSIADLRDKMVEVAPYFAKVDERVNAEMFRVGGAGKIESTAILSTLKNFYMTDPISRASRTMAKCVADINGDEEAA